MFGLWSRGAQRTGNVVLAWLLSGCWSLVLSAQAGTLTTYADDIRPRVFEPHCLPCHYSQLTGADRNGAPTDVNWDTYELAVQDGNAVRAVRRVLQGTMPPRGPLSTELMLLMLSWQEGGFINLSLEESCPPDGLISDSERSSPTPLDALLALQDYLGTADPPLNTCQQVRANVVEADSSPVTPADARCIFRRFLGFPSCFD